MERKKTIEQVEVSGRRVLMRVDYNVPIADGRISDDRRIVQSLDSVRSVIERDGRLVLMSHLGRPGGKGFEAEYSLRLVSKHMAELLGKSVGFAEDCVGPAADSAVASMEPGGVVLLENLRFHAEETLIDQAKKNPDRKPTAAQATAIDAFASGLARHGDVYCNNAFGTCHRKHVSMYDVPMKLGAGRRVCGHLVEKELRFLGEALARPGRPFVAILGGAKVSDKIQVIESLIPRTDFILIGGAMMFTFWAAEGRSVGKSLCEMDKLDLARGLLAKAGAKIRIPSDAVCAEAIQEGIATTNTNRAKGVPDGLMGLDIGEETIAAYGAEVRGAKTVLWNGPMGVFETRPFDRGTISIARAMAEATSAGATTIIGGGDSAAAVDEAGLADRMTHISTGGGASLEFLEGKSFATIELLDPA